MRGRELYLCGSEEEKVAGSGEKKWTISWPDEELLASQENVCLMDLVSGRKVQILQSWFRTYVCRGTFSNNTLIEMILGFNFVTMSCTFFCNVTTCSLVEYY